MNANIVRVLEEIKKKNATEPEFLQTVEEVYASLEPEVNKHPEYEKLSLLERIAEPERAISFRVTRVDDAGNIQVKRGYRIYFNVAIDQYKEGITHGFPENMRSDNESEFTAKLIHYG